MSWTLCTSNQAIVKAGANVNTTIKASNQALADLSDEAEALICATARYDVVTNYGSLTSNGKKILQTICSAHIAQNMVDYDIDALGNRQGETKLDVLENQIERGLKAISDGNIKKYLQVNSGG